MDLFEFRGIVYIIVIDYYSICIEIKRLGDQSVITTLKSESVIATLKELFAVHGIPDIVMSDNGHRFSEDAFRQFAAKYGFVHTTRSPRYAQANGEAERAVRTVKGFA